MKANNINIYGKFDILLFATTCVVEVKAES